jgi:hypothetical protein
LLVCGKRNNSSRKESYATALDAARPDALEKVGMSQACPLQILQVLHDVNGSKKGEVDKLGHVALEDIRVARLDPRSKTLDEPRGLCETGNASPGRGQAPPCRWKTADGVGQRFQQRFLNES